MPFKPAHTPSNAVNFGASDNDHYRRHREEPADGVRGVTTTAIDFCVVLDTTPMQLDEYGEELLVVWR